MKAAIILQRCTYTRKTFGIRVQQMEDGEWYKTWAFPLNEKTARKEGYGDEQIVSTLPALPEYPGCPYCAGTGTVMDSNCGNHLSCWDGSPPPFTCPWCNRTYNELGPWTEKAAFTGRDM